MSYSSEEYWQKMDSSDKNELFVYPWMGILANIPIEKRGGQIVVGASGSRYRDHLASEGFNPLKVQLLWNKKGFSGYALVEFNNGWPGFSNAMAFEKSYEANRHGKDDYHSANPKGDELYGWVARAGDYYSSGIIGVHLQKKTDLKTIADIEAEEKQKTSKLVTNLTNQIEAKNKCLKEIELKYNETSMTLSSVTNVMDEMTKLYNEKMQKMQERTLDEAQQIILEHQKIKLQLEAQREELKQREKELEKREANNENERQKFDLEKLMNAEAIMQQKKAENKLLELVEGQKREQEGLHKKIIDLEKELDAKQALELEIQRLRGAEQVMKHMEQDGDEQAEEQLRDIQCQLKEKEEDLERLDETTQYLIVKERRTTDELQEARKELITGLANKSSDISIGLKIMGWLDGKLFQGAIKGKVPKTKVAKLRSQWQEHLQNPNWHPFKVVKVEGSEEMQEIIDEDDEKLNGLMNGYGDQVYQLVVTALKELNEYNPSGRYPISEIWNFKENRKASLKEAIEYTLSLWKPNKRKRTRT